MKIGITGSTSGIGLHLVEKLQANGDTVLSLGGSNSSRWRLGQRLPRDLNIDALIHLAHDRTLSVTENVEAARAICDSFNGPKVFLSSFSAHTKSRSRYGKSKFEIEKIFKQSKGSILRAGIVYGQSVGGIFAQLEMLIKNLPVIPVPYFGSPLLFTTHIDDLVEEIIATLRHGDGSTTFAANATPISLEELIFQIKDHLGESSPTLLIWRQPMDQILIALTRAIPNFPMADSLLSLSNETAYAELAELKVAMTPFRSFDLEH